MNDDLRRAVVCPGCGKLTAAGAARCPFCGHHAPGLYGGSGGLRQFYERLPSFRTLLVVLAFGMFAFTYAMAWREGDGGPPNLLDTSHWGAVFLRSGAINARTVLHDHEFWRLWTYQFLHGGILHLGMNSLFLIVVGAAAEGIFGRARFLFAFSFTGVLAGLVSVSWRDHTGEIYVQAVGMSGALAGLLGLLLVHGARRKDALGRHLLSRTTNILVVNGILFLIVGGGLPIDHAAHLGGLAAGGFLGLFLRAADQRSRGDTPRVQLATVFLALSILGLQALGVVRGSSSWKSDLVAGSLARSYVLSESYSSQLAQGAWFSDKQEKLLVRADLSRALKDLEQWADGAELEGEEALAAQALRVSGRRLVDLLELVERPPELTQVAREVQTQLEALSARFGAR